MHFRLLTFFCASLVVGLLSPRVATAQKDTRVAVKMAQYPSLSPDGKRMVFDWKDDIWLANSAGGRARRLTQDDGRDSRGLISPDGKTVAFTSNRDGTYQVYVVPMIGGVPRQLTFHSEGSYAMDWYPDGKSLLVRGVRDEAGRYPYRFFRVAVAVSEKGKTRRAPVLLFDATGVEASLSPDGERLLFTREGMDLYRKGYRGSRAAQIWMAWDLGKSEPRFRRMSPVSHDVGARSPQWKADGSGYFYLGAQGESGVFEVRETDLSGKSGDHDSELTGSDGTFPVLRPKVSRDGSTLVFQRGFDVFRFDLSANEKVVPKKINLWVGDDGANDASEREMRRILSRATNLSFSSDGLEVAFIAGGDLWVMDTVLREPRQITATPEEENEPIFAPDDKSIFFIRDGGRSSDIFRAERGNPKAYWFLNSSFKHTRVTKDGEEKSDLHLVPGGKKIAFVRGLGDLWVANHDGGDVKKIIESWNAPSTSWSPDGKWLAYSISDDDFNRDIWIRPINGSREPFNVSRHPDSDSNPTWSADGKILAFTGRRYEDETDIYYVWLTKAGEQLDKRERTLREAMEKMNKERKPPTPPAAKPATPAEKKEPEPEPAKKPEPEPKAEPAKKPEPKAEPKPTPSPKKAERDDDPAKPAAAPKAEPKSAPKSDPAKPKPKAEEKKTEEKPEASATAAKPQPKPEVKIDFDGIYERIHRISIPNSDESGLFWSHDSKRLAFSAEVKGVKGTYMVTFPDKLTTPLVMTTKTGSFARWIAKNDTVLWMVDGKPSTWAKGKLTQYSVKALQTQDRQEYRREAFEQVWRTMRDHYYDGTLNHTDWDAMHDRYADMAAEAPGDRAFDSIVEMLLGELNGSHLGFSVMSSRSPSVGPWKNETAHLGLRFDRFHKGPGWKIAAVITDGPADRVGMNLKAGDLVLQVDRRNVQPATDPSMVLNGRIDRDIFLTILPVAEPAGVKEGDKKTTRLLRIRPISYAAARNLVTADHRSATRAKVHELSEGKLGYVYVPKMQWNEFVKFEEEIYACGAGHEGLIIDVRDNGGGFTSDHLLTVLTPARHAFTIPRGGGPGYPQDRRVYATWEKPIVVLCNQNSFSNAEIFAHAIKNLKRGKVVGETTAGGVISTGSTAIMDYGVLRMPFRGWFLLGDGEDMELNGAVPHVIVRNLPQDTAVGRDRQVEKAVQVLLRDVKAAAKKPRPKAKKASAR